MKFRRVVCPAYALAVLLLSVSSALGQGKARESPVPRPHDSDLDELLVTGAPTSDLPLLTQPLVDTPQTVTAIPEAVMQLQAAADVRDVLRNDPSVSSHADEDNAQRTN